MASDLTVLTRSALIAELHELHNGVREVVEALDDSQLWTKAVDPGNSVGHLVLHLTGNLNHFVGAQLGGTGNQRDREREFTETNRPPRHALLANLDGAARIFERVVSGVSAEQLAAPHPDARFGTVLKSLVHLVAHFALHRGQMTYISRLVKAGPSRDQRAGQA
jgi:uncharacterized damage-inducible protein DinB